jgi:hypothetical protein
MFDGEHDVFREGEDAPPHPLPKAVHGPSSKNRTPSYSLQPQVQKGMRGRIVGFWSVGVVGPVGCGLWRGVQGVLWAHTPGGKTARQRADVNAAW